ncbi:unnamed protein product, partial [Prorocentrum cordatum]
MRDTLMQKLMDVLDEERKKTNKDLGIEGEKQLLSGRRGPHGAVGAKARPGPCGDGPLLRIPAERRAIRPQAHGGAQRRSGAHAGVLLDEHRHEVRRVLGVHLEDHAGGNPTSEQKEAYTLAHKVQKQIIQIALVPGAVFRDIYAAARARVQEQSAVLVERFVKNVGFAMGLEFKDPLLVLSEKSDQRVLAGMVFCISVGFSADQGTSCAVWLSDTVMIPRSGGPCELLTGLCSSEQKDMWFEAGVDEAAPAAPAQTPPVQPSGG